MKKFTAIVHRGEPAEGGFWATCLEVPGANGQGETKVECLQNLKEAILTPAGNRTRRSVPARSPSGDDGTGAGMKRRALLGHLQEHGCVAVREGGSHSIWANPQTGRKEAIPGTPKSKNSWRVPFAAIFPCRCHREIKTPFGARAGRIPSTLNPQPSTLNYFWVWPGRNPCTAVEA